MDRLKHLKIDSFQKSKIFKVSGKGRSVNYLSRNHVEHASKLIEEFNSAIRDYSDFRKDKRFDAEDFVYLEIYSAFNVQFDYKKFDSDASNFTYKILTISKETLFLEGSEGCRYKLNLIVSKKGISKFLKLIQAYAKNEVDHTFDNVEEIKLATLRSFWSESKMLKFPLDNEIVWWEVWFRKTEQFHKDVNLVLNELIKEGATIGDKKLIFPEHIVTLIKGTSKQLYQTLLLYDNLSEIRKPRETAEYFQNLDQINQKEYVSDLIGRVVNQTNTNSVSVCILDTGIHNGHPLLSSFVPDSNLFTYKEEWGKIDYYPHGGHGTGMTGLALYADLVPLLESDQDVTIFHQLESVKIIDNRDKTEPHLYGYITEEACSLPIIEFPFRNRVYCMAVTAEPFNLDDENDYLGRPSSWSSAIDRFIFGSSDKKELFFVSAGNIEPTQGTDYKKLNRSSPIEDPGQAYNAITVGAMTDLDQINSNTYPYYKKVAQRGDLCPSSRTSCLWNSMWPIKPEIVLEGGNYAQSSLLTTKLDSLQMLTTQSDFKTSMFQTFGDTSGATALASKMAAQLMVEYPKFWTETIRALLIHSASWTEAMLPVPIHKMKSKDKKELLRTFGYGVPNLEKALYSVKNSVTLIAENKLTPFQRLNSEPKFNEYHLYELPWPKDILSEIDFTEDAKITATLSYFIEPNPGNRSYVNSHAYHSHGLAFRMIGKGEKLETFEKRISEYTRDEGETKFQSENWFLGTRARERGSIQKDFIVLSGIELAERNVIAIYPRAGWYKSRKKLNKFNEEVRYSLVISI